jgi:predicted membrane-bound mannosyltransferase
MVDRIEVQSSLSKNAESTEDAPMDQVVQPDRPDWLPEKFESAEAMAAAYAELEKKMGGGTPEESEESEQPTLTSDTLAKYSEKYFTDGLGEQDYAELEKMGISRELVAQYAAGMEALQDRQTQSAYRITGGQDNYEAMVQWAGQNMTEAQIMEFNQSVAGSDPAKIEMAVKGLYAQYQQSEGKEANLVQGSTSSSGEGVFQSTAELMRAMQDSRYEKDAAYRNQIIQRLARSSAL